MDHYRLLFGAVLSYIFHIEIERELEVELYCTHLPFSAQSVLHFEVYFGSVERTVTLVEFIAALTVNIVEYSFKVCFRLVPDVDIAHIIIGTGGKLSAVGEPEGVVELGRDAHDVLDLVGYLFLGDKDMRIVLTEKLHTEQTVQLAGFLLAVNGIDLIYAYRQLSV